MTIAAVKEWNAQVGRNVFRAEQHLMALHPTVSSLLEMEAIQLEKMLEVPITDMAFADRTPSKFGIIKIYWDDEGVDPRKIQQTAREMVEIIESGDSMGETTYINRGESLSRLETADTAYE